MYVRYVHTLTFKCPDCGHSVSVNRLRYRPDLEAASSLRFRIQCWSCGKAADTAGIVAVSHAVKEWRNSGAAPADTPQNTSNEVILSGVLADPTEQ